jgi:hypothetical protein
MLHGPGLAIPIAWRGAPGWPCPLYDVRAGPGRAWPCLAVPIVRREGRAGLAAPTVFPWGDAAVVNAPVGRAVGEVPVGRADSHPRRLGRLGGDEGTIHYVSVAQVCDP